MDEIRTQGRTETFAVTIVTPGGVKEEYNVRHLRAPGSEGDFGVLPGHIPFMTTLRVGELQLDTVQGRQRYAISGGYAEVLGERVTILAETAERGDKVDPDRAEAARKRALDRLAAYTPDIDTVRAKAALARAINRLQIHSNYQQG